VGSAADTAALATVKAEVFSVWGPLFSTTAYFQTTSHGAAADRFNLAMDTVVPLTLPARLKSPVPLLRVTPQLEPLQAARRMGAALDRATVGAFSMRGL
jgi:hypothetical protein